jgi:sigma-B regulation protein RsbU (phosphoserine phosphatase)
MASLSDIRKELGTVKELERELNLKQVQVNRLLGITQAINNNTKALKLFEMYSSFLNYEMGVRKMALFFKEETGWQCKASVGVKESLLTIDISDRLEEYVKLHKLEDVEHPLISEFELVIPVLHKKLALAYVFIGGFSEEEDMYSKVQFITTLTNIIAVAIENKRLFKRQLEQERLKREMELASEMQRMLIPESYPCCKQYELASIYKPQMGVGGDYYDYLELGDDRFAFCIGDISGKGVAAALLMSNFQATFHSLIHVRSNLADLIRALNLSVQRITKGEKFITFFVAEYDLPNRMLYYVNAGHNPPILATEGKIHRLDKGCTILGAFKEIKDLEIGSIHIPSSAMILAFTDGLIDIKNAEGEFMDDHFDREFVLKHADLSAEAFNQQLLNKIEKFKGEQSYPDDFTVLTCKFF